MEDCSAASNIWNNLDEPKRARTERKGLYNISSGLRVMTRRAYTPAVPLNTIFFHKDPGRQARDGIQLITSAFPTASYAKMLLKAVEELHCDALSLLWLHLPDGSLLYYQMK